MNYPPNPSACYQCVYAILQAAKVNSVVNAILPLPLGEEVIMEVDSVAQITDYSQMYERLFFFSSSLIEYRDVEVERSRPPHLPECVIISVHLRTVEWLVED